MARYICPSCGSRYNGRKCRNCLYEHFTEEIAHGGHTHEGEPLVIDAPVRKPIKRKDPFGCEKKTKAPKKKRPFVNFVILLAVINSLLPMLQEWGLELEARENDYFAVAPESEPEPFIPEGAALLWEEGAVRIYADWENRRASDYFDIYIENDYNYDLIVYSQNVVVNGYLMEYSGVYIDAYKGSTTRSTFYFDGADLDAAGIDAVQSLSFCLEVYDEDYAHLFTTDTFVMTGSSDPGTSAVPDGTVLYQGDDLEVRYLGYEADPYDIHNIAEGRLQFYLENSTDRTLQFYTAEASVAGGATELYFWKELPPHTRCIVRMYMNELDVFGIDSLAEASPMTIRLDISDPNDLDFHIFTDAVELPLE